MVQTDSGNRPGLARETKQLEGCSYGLVRGHVNVINQKMDGVFRNGSLHGSAITVVMMIWGPLGKVPRHDKQVIEELRAGAFLEMSLYRRVDMLTVQSVACSVHPGLAGNVTRSGGPHDIPLLAATIEVGTMASTSGHARRNIWRWG